MGGWRWWGNITPRCAKTTGNPPLYPSQHSTHAELTDKDRRLSETERRPVPFSIDHSFLSLPVGALCNLIRMLNGGKKRAKLYWLFKFLRTSDEKVSICVKYGVVFRAGIVKLQCRKPRTFLCGGLGSKFV